MIAGETPAVQIIAGDKPPHGEKWRAGEELNIERSTFNIEHRIKEILNTE
jgi:hypothetical protein